MSNINKKENKFLSAFNKWGSIVATVITLASVLGGYQVLEYRMSKMEKNYEKEIKVYEQIDFSGIINSLESIDKNLADHEKVIEKVNEKTDRINTRIDESYNMMIKILNK